MVSSVFFGADSVSAMIGRRGLRSTPTANSTKKKGQKRERERDRERERERETEDVATS